MQVNLEFVSRSIGGKIIYGNDKGIITAITTDSRSMQPGSLFIALKGDRFDGHEFVLQALDKGARAAVVSRKPADLGFVPDDAAVILVDDTLQALQDLAASYRMQFKLPVIAVTGSVGKTTTKELIASCLSSTWKTLKTEGNFNNDIGLPLTLLQMDDSYQAAVVEMGMRGLGEIRRLAAIARPSFALISNIEPVHLETLGSMENIARAKCEVLAAIPADGFALINGDHKLLVEAASEYPCPLYTFGYNKECDFQARECRIAGSGMQIRMRLPDGMGEELFFPLPAAGLALNVVSAAALSSLLGIDFASIRSSLRDYRPSGNRLHIISLEAGGVIINDTYNANPVSMAAALETGRQLARPGKYAAVLGDMYELGSLEEEGHLIVGQKAHAAGVDLLVAVGEKARDIARGAIAAGMDPNQVHYFKTKAEGMQYLQTRVDNSWIMLFKASRGMQLETMVDELEKTIISPGR